MEGFEFASQLINRLARSLSNLARSLLACAMATLGGTLLIAALNILCNLPWLYGHPSQNPFGVFNTSAYGILIVIAFSSLVLVGLPLQVILQKFKLNGWVITVIAGALAGLILGYLIDYGFFFKQKNSKVRAPALGN